MKLADVSIRRPVLATVMVAVLVVFGLVAYPQIGVDLFPEVEFPIVTVVGSRAPSASVSLPSTATTTVPPGATAGAVSSMAVGGMFPLVVASKVTVAGSDVDGDTLTYTAAAAAHGTVSGGANGTSTFVIQTIQTAFNFRQVGLASAMAVVLLLIVLLVTWVQRKLFPDEKVDLT